MTAHGHVHGGRPTGQGRGCRTSTGWCATSRPARRAQPAGADRGRAPVTTAEIFFEHASAGLGSKMMWLPAVLGLVARRPGWPGFSRRLAKTALPVASAAIVPNGVQGNIPAGSGDSAEAGRLVECAPC
jgi:hypothetical protein